MRRGVLWRELFLFVAFFFLGPLIWVVATGSHPAQVEAVYKGLFRLEVTSIFTTLAPYLVFQLLRVLFFGLGRQV